MTFVQATTGGGGWPMSVWLTPELKPFYRRNVFSARQPLWPRRASDACCEQHRRSLAARIAQRIVESSAEVHRAVAKQYGECAAPVDDSRLDEACSTPASSSFRRSFDTRLRRIRRRAEVSAPGRAQFPAALLRADRETRKRSTWCSLTLRADGEGRHERSARRRLPSLLGGRALVRAALREDAVRPGAAGHLVPRGVTRSRATRRYAESARDILEYVLRDMTRPGRRLLLGRRCRQRDRSGRAARKGRRRVLHLDAVGDRDAARSSPRPKWFAIGTASKPNGNVREDPHRRVHRASNILFQAHTMEETAAHFEKPVGRGATRYRGGAKREAAAVRARSACGRTWTTRCSRPGTA